MVMDNGKLNETILNYFKSPNYIGSIMLSAEWGAGKSFYLQKELIPYLEKNKVNTIVVSLHGLKNDFEISKAIYVEYLLLKDKDKIIRNKILKTKKGKCTVEHSKLAVKTIVRGISSFFNVDLSCSEEDLKKLYNSIDLSNTLVVFEDVERSKIPVEELLAYVNNLVEYDQVKVVLITNEKELEGKDIERYKKIKEKTVGDTITFVGDPIIAMDSMIRRFDDVRIKDFFAKANDDSFVSKLILKEIKDPINLRSIMFGLEKFKEMVLLMNKDIDFEFEKNTLIATLLFVHKYRKDNTIKWDTEESASTKLGSISYPLYKFIFDYLISNEIDANEFLKKESEYKEIRALSASKSELNKKLEILYSCYIQKEQDVKDTISYIKVLLQSEKIPYELYLKIANYLFYLRPIINYDSVIDECLELMIINIRKINIDDFDRFDIYGGIVLSDDNFLKYEEYKNKIKAIVKKNKMNPLDFSYKLEDLDSFCKMADNSRDSYYINKAFALLLDINRLISLIKKCSAVQINKIRGVFINIYSSSNIKEFFFSDKDNLIRLRDELLKAKKYKNFDAIQRHQITMMINNLNEILNRLDRGY